MKIDTQHHDLELDDYTSPPPSPPPIHALYTDGSIYRGTYSVASHIPTRHNVALYGHEKPPPLLVPKASSQDDDYKKKQTPQQRRLYGYMRKVTIYGVKQLMKKNNLALVINLVHQGWRARFFVARTIQQMQQTLVKYPFYYMYYRTAVIQAAKLILMLAKKEHRGLLLSQQNKRLSKLDLRMLIGLTHLYMTMITAQIKVVAQLAVKTGMGALKHLGAWDSLMMAFTSVALTRSLQNPSHWM